MIKQHFFIFDPSQCFGCFGCVSACVNVNKTKEHWRRVFKLPPCNGMSDTLYLSMSCNHCEEPACVKACPTNAMTKRKKDGIVLHTCERCIGCKYCQMACPYGAIEWDEANKTVAKCTMCHERLDRGEEPACVSTCFGGALALKTVDSVEKIDVLSKEMIGFTHYNEAKPSIRFTQKFNVFDQKEHL